MEKNSQESIPILDGVDNVQVNYGATQIPIKNRRKSFQLTYPKAVIFVLASKFFEAFAANGVRTVMALYLRDELDFSEESSTSFYHIFNFFSQFCPIFGAIIADSYSGNVKTIFYLFFLYACGWTGIVVFTFPFKSLPITPLVISSLILISIGNGSIRACITSLGGSQFKMPEQSSALNQYFSHYYFVYTLGIMLSKILPPMIRAQTQCFGKNDCYAAVFGSLATIFLISWVVFLFGICIYKSENDKDSEGNMLLRVIGCICFGVKRKLNGSYIPSITNNSWIDGSVEKYSQQFVEDVSAFLKVLKLFIPLPIYWALFAQIDSSWTFQSSELNTTIRGYKFEADQAKAVGAILLLILIPLWERVTIPTLLKFNINPSPMRLIFWGGISAGISFMCAGILQIHLERGSKLSILWQFPQFCFIMLGEVMLSIPGLKFSFTQAPLSMKSVMTAAWFSNNAFGNLIVVAITEMQPFKLQSNTFFLYAFLMFGGMIAFSWIAKQYRYTEYEDFSNRQSDSTINLMNSQSTRSVNYLKSQENIDLIL